MLIVEPEERSTYEAEGHWSATETLSSLLARRARETPDAEAVVDALGARLTYADLDRDATALAAALSARGVGTGGVVGMQLPNWAESSVVVAAVEKLGAVIVPLTPMLRQLELAYVIERTGMAVLVTPGRFRGHDFDALALEVRGGAPALRGVVTLSRDAPEGLESFAALLAEGAASAAARDGRFDDPAVDPNAPAAILLTSGTEAAPKAVIHTNNTLLAHNRALTAMLGLSSGDHVFMPSPVGHGTGFGSGTRLAIHLGSKLVLQDIWDPATAARLLAAERCGYTQASTTFAHDLLELDGVDGHDLSALRYFVCGGAAVPPGFVRRVRETLGCQLLRLYGQTEAFMISLNRPQDPEQILDSRDGRAVPGIELAAWGPDDRPLAPGEVGELVCRGAIRCRGFFRDPERTARAIRADGWMRTGDLGVLDEAGYVRIVGRTKEVISRGGDKFSPREVEDLLVDHPAVARVAIVRVPDERLGERACACVIPRGETAPTLDDLVSYLRGRGLAPFKLPERIEIVMELPTTPSGKVKRFELERRLSASAEGVS